jgi:ketosteroid isomerase-like protein
MNEAVRVVLEAFAAVERRDGEALAALYHPEIEFHWPPSLPFGGSASGSAVFTPGASRWSQTWDPLQGEDERRMDPRVIAASEDEVVVLYHQRAVDAAGERLDHPVLGLYHVRDGKLARAQMFYFDTVAVGEFLARARTPLRPT